MLVQCMNQTKMLVPDMDLVYATLYVGSGARPTKHISIEVEIR